MTELGGYSLENAMRYQWSSVSGELNPGRTALLDEHLIGPRVLDAGCGGGGYCEYLAQKGFEPVGIDLHDTFLETARQRFPRLDFRAADITRLPFPDASFDSVFCFDVLEHVDDRAALSELIRVCSKRLILAVPRRGDEMLPFNLVFSTYIDTTHLRYYTDESLLSLIGQVAPSTQPKIVPELMLPTNRLLEHLCDPMACGYIGPLGLVLRTARFAGFPTDRVAHVRGQRLLRRISDHAARRIPTGLTAVINLVSR